MRWEVLVALVTAIIIVTSGCLGNSSTTSSTVTVTMTTTTTETVTKTPAPVIDLAENLSRCMEHLTYLNRTLNETEARLSNVTEKYERCLVDLAVLGNSTTSLKNCQAELERTKSELRESEKELGELQINLSRCNEELETTLSGDLTVKLLTDGEYYRNVIDTINSAEKSIYVMMFSMKYDPDDSFDWANDLIRALVAAKNRGVDVHVLLDDSIEGNEEAYSYLRSHGVDVSFDSPETTLHAKVIVIDRRLVFLGSHNWSESALYWNHEISLMVASEELAERLIEYFESVR